MTDVEVSGDLLSLLQEYCPEKIEEITGVLAPYYEIAKTGIWPLLPSEKLDREVIAITIKKALGLRYNPRIEFHSLANSLSKSRNSGIGYTWGYFWDNTWNTIGDDIHDNLWRNLFGSIGELRSRVAHALWINLTENLRTSLENSLRSSYFAQFLNNIRESLYYYIGFCLAKNESIAYKLSDLLKIHGCLVIGEKESNEKVWIVLCAEISSESGDDEILSKSKSDRIKKGDWSRVTGQHNGVWGNGTNIRGDASYIRGDVTYVVGDVTGIHGDATDFHGPAYNIRQDANSVPPPVPEPNFFRDIFFNIFGGFILLIGDVNEAVVNTIRRMLGIETNSD